MKKIILSVFISTFALGANSATWQKISGSSSGGSNILYNCHSCNETFTNPENSTEEKLQECVLNCKIDDLKSKTNVLIAGRNSFFTGDNTNRTRFEYISNTMIKYVKKIDSDLYVDSTKTQYYIDKSNNLYLKGTNNYGQLGFGDLINRNHFEKSNLENVKNCTFFNQSTICVKNDGTVWGAGYNGGYLGVGDTTQKNSFTQAINEDGIYLNNVRKCQFINSNAFVGVNSLICIKNDNSVVYTGYPDIFGQYHNIYNNFVKNKFNIIENEKLKDITENGYLIIKENETVFGFGYNDLGQIGTFDNVNEKYRFSQSKTSDFLNISNVKKCSSNYRHTVCVKNDGTVWVTGNNGNGQLGLGDTTTRYAFTQTSLSDVKDCITSDSATNNYTVCVKNDGTVWGAGRNLYGELGVGDTTQRNSFTQAIKKDGTYLNNINKCSFIGAISILCIEN